MRRQYATTLLVLAGWSSFCLAEEPYREPANGCSKGLLGRHCASYHGIRCYEPLSPEPCVCEDPCAKRWHLCLPGQSARTAKLLEQLHDCHYRCREEAAHKLGSRVHTDFCRHREIVPALVHTLQCDPCWVVRRAAAKALGYQVVADQFAWSALFLASRLDPHYLVREQAADSLTIIQTQITPACIKEWRAEAEAFEKQMKGKYKPGKETCREVFPPFCSCMGSVTTLGRDPQDRTEE